MSLPSVEAGFPCQGALFRDTLLGKAGIIIARDVEKWQLWTSRGKHHLLALLPRDLYVDDRRLTCGAGVGPDKKESQSAGLFGFQ